MNWISDHFRISYATSALIIAYKAYSYYIYRYLTLMEFKVCAVSYRLSFFQLTYGPTAKQHASHKLMGKNKDLAYGLVSELRRHIT